MMTSFEFRHQSLPFAGLKVIELAGVLAGPAVGMFFAELGADVIKVENHASGGDVTRTWRLASEPDNEKTSAYYCSVNWGKQNAHANLKTATGVELVKGLIADADIVLVNFKQGDAARYGLDFESCRAINEKLIYASLTGYGEADSRPGLDVLIQATSGFLSMTGTQLGELCKMPVALIDLLAAHQLKEGILIALMARMKTGRGQKVDVNLFQSAVASLANQASNYFKSGVAPKPMGSQHPNIAPYGTIVKTADNVSLVLALGSDKQFFGFCELVQPSLADDTRFYSNADRVKNRDALNQILADAVKQQSSQAFLQALRKKEILVDCVATLKDVFEKENLAQQMVLKNSVGQKGAVRTVAFALSDLCTKRDDLREPS